MNHLFFALLLLPLALAGPAVASPVYSETFTAGAALSADPLVNTSNIGSYWLDGTNNNNGYVTQTTNTSTIAFGQYGNDIAAGPGGSGYFLFNGTNAVNSTGNNTFFASSTFAVTQNTSYALTFTLTNASSINGNNSSLATVQAQMNGVGLLTAGTSLSTVSATGYNSDGISGDGWQTFIFTWNSGSNTTASLALLDTNTAATGNNFGIDNISVYATPEPSSLGLGAIGSGMLLAALALRRRRRLT